MGVKRHYCEDDHLTDPVTVCRPNDSFHIHSEPQAGGNTVQRIVGQRRGQVATFVLLPNS